MLTMPGTKTARFDVEPDFALPDLNRFAAGEDNAQVTTTESETTYYDTAEKDLQRLRLTLSRRTGESAAGWLLETSGGDVEMQSTSTSTTVPDPIADVLLGIRRGQDLTPVLSVSRADTAYRIPGAAGTTQLELVDTRLEAVTMGLESSIAGWRTIELSAGGTDADTLSEVCEELRSLGAVEPSSSRLDVLLSLGAIAEQEADLSHVGGLVQAYLRQQIEAINRGDLGLRMGRAVVHPTRVGLRRLRSTLRVFRTVFEPQQATVLNQELRWIAVVLGQVRDAEILSARLESQVSELPAEEVLGPVASHIRGTLAQQRAGYLEQVAEALNSDRYLQLLRTMNEWRLAAPLTDASRQPAAAAAEFLSRARRTFNRRLQAALENDPTALHAARKAAKRLRYAAELAEPALGHKAAKTVQSAKEIQTSLGEYQDASVSREFLRRVGAEAGSTIGHNGFTYGLLAAHEQVRMEKVIQELTQRLSGSAT